MKYLILILLPFSVFASPWVTNKDHSEIFFEVPYMNVSEVTGRFNAFTGEADIDEKGAVNSVEVKIQVSSIDTGNKMRDNHLQGSEFFQAREFPEIRFKGQSVKKISKDQYEVKGLLTIKNVSKLSTFLFTITDSLKDTWGYENRFVKFKGDVKREDFNIKWNKTLDNQKYLIGDVVSFHGSFQMQPESAKTPNSKHMIPDTEYIRGREEKVREESSFSQKIRKLINGK